MKPAITSSTHIKPFTVVKGSSATEKKPPVSAALASAACRFIPETASELEAQQLELASIGPGQQDLNEQLQRIIQIKSYVNSAGQPAREYLAGVIASSAITIIGESHTVARPNPHRVLGTEVICELPAGSTLAVEFPSSLRPLFKEFNDKPGSDFRLHAPMDHVLNTRLSMLLLQSFHLNYPDLIHMWKSVRDKGIHVIPIDCEPNSSIEFADDFREGELAEGLLSLYRQNSKPIVAWVGNVHAGKNTEAGVSLLAKRIAESPDFAQGGHKLSTVLSQIEEPRGCFPLKVLADIIPEPLALPTALGKQESPIGSIPVFDNATAKFLRTSLKVADYDHLILYPANSNKLSLSADSAPVK